jgi:signal transduction histidine kinase
VIRLAEFITANSEAILVEWEAFARTRGAAGGGMDVAALRDHAAEMLAVIAADLNTPQGSDAQAEKGKGRAPAEPRAADGGTDRLTAAAEHGAGRAESGFTVEQMVSEFRALRASVIRLWTAARADGRDGVSGALDAAAVEDLTRFHEAIDQALAESVTRYTQDINESKEMFLAILGHDLRTPLGATLMASRFMLDTEELPEPHATLAARIATSSTRMLQMVGDLLDFTRSRLGGGIPIVRADVNVGKVVHDVVDELAAAHPRRTLTVDGRGAQHAAWDAARISQALGNLLGNALEHGIAGEPVGVEIRGTPDDVTIAIHNRGPTIPAPLLEGIFRPMKGREARAHAAATGPLGNLGLGLYIADRIIHAHRGRIAVESSAARGTTFTVHLPRHA